jgi:hypothetical protein
MKREEKRREMKKVVKDSNNYLNSSNKTKNADYFKSHVNFKDNFKKLFVVIYT